MEIWHRITNWIDHNRGVFFGIVFAVLLGGWIIGCQAKMPGLVEDEPVILEVFRAQVDRAELDIKNQIAAHHLTGENLQATVDALNAKVEYTEEGFAKKIEFNRAVVEFGGGIISTLISGGTIDAADKVGGFITLLLGAGVLGLAVDNNRKDRKITGLKETATPTMPDKV